MKKLILCLAFLAPVAAFALDAGVASVVVVADAGIAVVADAGVAVVTDGAIPASLETPLPYAKIVFQSIAHGEWWAAAAAFLVLVVALLRKYGKWLHEKIPDTNPIDKIFWFLLETKPGGWVLNVLTAVAGGAGGAILAGEKIDWPLVKPILLVSVTGSTLWELFKDVSAYVASVKAAKSVPAPVLAVVPPVDPPKP